MNLAPGVSPLPAPDSAMKSDSSLLGEGFWRDWWPFQRPCHKWSADGKWIKPRLIYLKCIWSLDNVVLAETKDSAIYWATTLETPHPLRIQWHWSRKPSLYLTGLHLPISYPQLRPKWPNMGQNILLGISTAFVKQLSKWLLKEERELPVIERWLAI